MNKFLSVLISSVLFMSGCIWHQVEPGNRGVVVTMGVVEPESRPPGLVWGIGFSEVYDVSVRQRKEELTASCFSSDLQEINIKLSILYSVPEVSAVKIHTEYLGEPFDVLVASRVQESIKDSTSSRSAEQIVKQRDAIKAETLSAVRKKVGTILNIEDIIVADIGLSAQLKSAIESKMVQEQEAAKAKYTNQKAEADADTARSIARGEADSVLIRAKAEAESIFIRGEALQKNPSVVSLQLIEKWDGKAPQIVGGGSNGINLLMPALR